MQYESFKGRRRYVLLNYLWRVWQVSMALILFLLFELEWAKYKDTLSNGFFVIDIVGHLGYIAFPLGLYNIAFALHNGAENKPFLYRFASGLVLCIIGFAAAIVKALSYPCSIEWVDFLLE